MCASPLTTAPEDSEGRRKKTVRRGKGKGKKRNQEGEVERQGPREDQDFPQVRREKHLMRKKIRAAEHRGKVAARQKELDDEEAIARPDALLCRRLVQQLQEQRAKRSGQGPWLS